MDRSALRIHFAVARRVTMTAGLIALLQGCGGDSGDAAGGGGNTTPPTVPGASSGLDTRPANTTCLAGDAPSSQVSLAVERVFPAVRFGRSRPFVS